MIPYFHCLWKYGLTRGLWMLPVQATLGLWNTRPSTCRQAIVCSTMVLSTAPTTSGSFSPSSMPLPFAGIRVCTTRLSTAILTMPSSGFRSANVRQNLSATPRRNRSSRSLPEQKTGSTPTTIVIPSSSGKRRNGVRSQPILGANKVV